jgi:GGDEF domain-containing protein
VAGPTVFGLIAAALIIYNHVQDRVTDLAFWLGLALIASVFSWMIQNNHRRARIDAMTGLANRLRLQADLRQLLASSAELHTLVLLELEGVAAHRDLLGFEAGDDLVRSFSRELAGLVDRLGGTAYRVDGAQFCALVPGGRRGPDEIVMAISESATNIEDETIGQAHGVVALPEDTVDPDLALQIAGQRLAADKRRQRRSAKHQAHDALTAVLNARHPEMSTHVRAVAFRAIAVGRLLGLGREQLDDVVFAARLQHVGMLAVADATLERQADLSAGESKVIRGLPAVGASIIASAPALAPVATLVRSSYENYDGTGYPDGLAGERIPLGSRIMAVCVAFTVLTSERADRRTRTPEEALAELRRCAGAEFDPRVVEALAEDMADDLPQPRP